MIFSEKRISTCTRISARVTRWIANLIIPPACVLCGGTAKHPVNLCDACLKDLPSLPYHCRQCAQFLTAADHHNRLCGTCLTEPPPYEQLHALFPYQPPVTQLILNLKFNQGLSAGKTLGELLSAKINTWYSETPLPDLIIPVPLHPKRLSERGYNQAAEIARPLARLGIAIDNNGLQRSRHTEAQSGLTASKRSKNVANAFSTKRQYHGSFIALVDDVVTTGETIKACAHTLKAAGAAKIHVWCCARAG